MPFSSLLFLSGFLPLFLAVYWLAPRALKNTIALLFSVLFYVWGAPRFLPFVLGLGVIDYFLSHQVARRRASRDGRILLTVGIVIHLSTLGYFKYANFFVGEVSHVLVRFSGTDPIPWSHVVLPIGISFITFEEISYLVDVYRGDAQPAKTLPRYLLFLMLFPHSIAGPIFRWKDLEAQLRARKHSLELTVSGFTRFSFGLAKKVLVADVVALAVDPIFALPSSDLTTRLAWIGAIAYTLQIYFDFSGYSDMAIGLGRLAGFSFKENFDRPYVSESITEFWRRWHISLSTWMRDYLYVSLGGNRGSTARTRLNVFLVFLLSGLWHGSSWSFIVWGAYHGFFVVLERIPMVRAAQQALPRAVNLVLTLVVVCVGWVFFRAPSLPVAGTFLSAMFGAPASGVKDSVVLAEVLPYRTIAMMAIGTVVALAPFFVKERKLSETTERRLAVALATLAPLFLVFSIARLANSKFVPLIYFKF